MKMLIFVIVLFLILGGFLIVLNNDLNLEKKEGKKTFVLGFAHWVYNLGVNVKNVVGYAVGMEWLPEKSLNSTTTTYEARIDQ
jgi:transketolase C-terminal domain/subunit